MSAPSPPTTPPVPETPVCARGTQYAVGLLIAVSVLLVGVRWFIDRSGPRPAEMKNETPHRVEINKATRSELMQLPGIGPTRADKILAYRKSKGSFERVEDLRSVEGIGDITLERIRKHVHVDARAIDEESDDEPLQLTRKPSAPAKSTAKTPSKSKPGPDGMVDLNRASVSDLQRLPGIGPTLAQRIVDERERKAFAKVDELRRVSGIGVKRLEQLKPFVVVGD